MLRTPHLLLLALLFTGLGKVTGQSIGFTVARLVIVDGDTIPRIELPEVCIWGPLTFKSKADERKYNKLVRNVKRVYPYAKLAGSLLREYEVKLIAARNDAERRKLMKQAEKELKDRYGDELKKLTFSQGHILIKLVDRETGHSTYSLVEELRGRFLAFFWQNFARIFGYNLKDEYEPYGRDRQIENIVQMIEAGAI
ncbi:MAG TPA: DUF4294 domain-containing protein [Bacteroidales bacterium]|nr:DUF4294 domain-containing protein [Bacteroidales bacterium]